jgi:SAM-dependent methyltransferase
MTDDSKGQVTQSAAEIYEMFFVPALFQAWVGPMAAAAKLAPGQTALDIACGTGVLAREAARRVAPGGKVIGLDRNDGMLTMARRMAPEIEWREARAESLPFANDSFDAVLSQFGLMFFEDPIAALEEMWRVLRPAGRLAVAVWASADKSSGYAAMIALLERLFGEPIADELRAPFRLGDPALFVSLFDEAGIPAVDIRSHDGMARFPSIEAWVHTDIKGWTLADRIDETQYKTLLEEAQKALRPYLAADGTVTFRCPALIATAGKA